MNELEIRDKLITEMSVKRKKLRLNNIFNYVTSFSTGGVIGLMITNRGNLKLILNILAIHILLLVILWIAYTALSNHKIDKLVKAVIKNTKDINDETNVMTAIELVVRLL